MKIATFIWIFTVIIIGVLMDKITDGEGAISLLLLYIADVLTDIRDIKEKEE